MDVSMQTFFAVLEGNASGVRHGGRVLNSTENDNVFIIYTDHGAPGYVTFPSGPAMHAGDLNDALVRMHAAKRYKQALLYMDACNAGSMFASGLLKAPNLLAVTAATGEEESFAAFCPPFDRIVKENNRETFSCLGDIFTIGWILDDAGQAEVRREAAAGLRLDVRVPRLEHLGRNQIFNPTSMWAYSNSSTHALRLCFENSMRAIDSSKNQPNRRRFDRAREG